MSDSPFDLHLENVSHTEFRRELERYISNYNAAHQANADNCIVRLKDQRNLAKRITASGASTLSEDDYRKAQQYNLIAQESSGWIEFAKTKLGRLSDLDAKQLEEMVQLTDESIERFCTARCQPISIEATLGERDIWLYRLLVRNRRPDGSTSDQRRGWITAQSEGSDLRIDAQSPAKAFVTGFYSHLDRRLRLSLPQNELATLGGLEERHAFANWVLGEYLPEATDPIYFTPLANSQKAVEAVSTPNTRSALTVPPFRVRLKANPSDFCSWVTINYWRDLMYEESAGVFQSPEEWRKVETEVGTQYALVMRRFDENRNQIGEASCMTVSTTEKDEGTIDIEIRYVGIPNAEPLYWALISFFGDKWLHTRREAKVYLEQYEPPIDFSENSLPVRPAQPIAALNPLSVNEPELPFELVELQRKLMKNFSWDELKQLVLELGEYPENIPGATVGEYARELGLYAHRRGRMNKLIELCKRERPQEEWDK